MMIMVNHYRTEDEDVKSDDDDVDDDLEDLLARDRWQLVLAATSTTLGEPPSWASSLPSSSSSCRG